MHKEEVILMKATAQDELLEEPLTVSLKTLAFRLDASRSSVRRWLNEAGIRPISLSSSAKGSIRYRWSDVRSWLESREFVE